MTQAPRPPSMLSRHFARLRGDSFLKAAGVLVGGTASAQLVAVLALPVLTRLYSVEDFSILAIYVALLTLIGAVVCLRLDTAIPLPEDDDEAMRLLILAVMSTICVTGLLGMVILIWGQTLAEGLGRADMVPYLWLLPIGAALMGFYSAFQFMAVRRKAFGLIARTRLTQALAGLGAQIGLGLAAFAPVGLLIGHAIMSGAGVVALARRGLAGQMGASFAENRGRLLETLRQYKRFPQFSVAEELINNAGIQLPILLIGLVLIGPEAGYLFLAMKVVGMPLAIVGGAVSQVYYAHASEYLRQRRLAEETARLVQRLSLWIVAPLMLIGPIAPDLFRVVFGPEWERAGLLLVWMLPWYAYRLLVSPISMVMYARGLQHVLLGFAALGLFMRVVPLGVVLVVNPEGASLTYAVSSATYYLLLLVAILTAAQISLKKAIGIAFLNSAIWCVFAAVPFSIIALGWY